jgi:general secretion pathway protein C
LVLNPRYYTALNLLVLSIIIYVGVDVFYTLAGSKLADVAEEQIGAERFKVEPPQQKSRSLSHYLTAADRNLFGEVKEERTELKAEDLEPTELKVELLGTVSGDSQNAAAIIQEGAKRTQALYKEGDSIQGATIIKILRGKVILRVGGQNQVLTMEEKPRASASASARRSPVGPSGPSSRPSTTITLDRSTVTKSLDDLNELLSQVRVRPHYRDGKADGLMLSQIKPNTVFTKMRLRNGDVVQRVNGKPITSPDEIMEFYEELRSGSSVSLDISRRGRSRTLSYQFR